MSHHRTALILRAGAWSLVGATAAAAVSPYWPAAIGSAYGAALLAWCGRCEAALARRERVMAQRAEMAARPAPCCLLWQLSGGGDHGADCHLGPDLVEGIARGWAALNAACCLASWESCGAQHDTVHCTRKTA